MSTLVLPVLQHLDRPGELERQALSALTHLKDTWKSPAVLWSTGKDSTTILWMMRKLWGTVPFPVIHMDTRRKPPEVYRFRDRIAREWQLPLVITRNDKALLAGVGPETGRYRCCTELKTNTLKAIMQERKFDAIVVTIRHDEHEVRGMEQILSLRDEQGNWKFWERYRFDPLDTEVGISHVRVHPLINWTEEDVWRYIRANHIPVNPLYFANEGHRYRSIGCYCCTEPLASTASNLDEIIREVHLSKGREREGRVQDKETAETMLELRAVGYL